MEKKYTPLEAWIDFFESTKAGPDWSSIDRATRQRLYTLDANYKSGRLGISSIKKNLERYAPGRFVFHAGDPFFTIQTDSQK